MQEAQLEVLRNKSDRIEPYDSAKEEFFSIRNESIEFFDQQRIPLPSIINSIYIKTVIIYTTNKK